VKWKSCFAHSFWRVLAGVSHSLDLNFRVENCDFRRTQIDRNLLPGAITAGGRRFFSYHLLDGTGISGATIW